ncbi:MAG: DsbA family protein [Pseudomonadota bacterium]
MRKFTASALVAGFFAIGMIAPAPADEVDFDAMTTEQRAAFGEQVRAYLLENPNVIFEAIQILEQQREQESADADRQLVAANAEELFNDGFSYVGGNPEGDVTIVEFLDYRCGYCKRAHPEIEELLDLDPDVRLIVKDFPILGPDSVSTGKIALAAHDVDAGKFKALNDAMMTYEGGLTEDAAYRIAADVGYDISALKEAANSQRVDDRLARNYQLAQALGLQGTPAFIVGDQVIRGYMPVNDMLAVVDQVRAASN